MPRARREPWQALPSVEDVPADDVNGADTELFQGRILVERLDRVEGTVNVRGRAAEPLLCNLDDLCLRRARVM